MSLPNPYVAILDVGHGNSAILHDQENSFIVDCVPGSSILEFLTSEGIKIVDSVFLSHADQDHIEGLVNLIASDEITINKVYVNSDSTKKSALWDDLLFTISKSSAQGGTQLHIGLTRTSGTFQCGSINLETVGPSAYLAGKSPGGENRLGRKITSNSISSSFRISWNSKIVAYLAGDIDQVSLDDIVEFEFPIDAPLLVFPHHGGKSDNADITVFSEQLCELVKAETVIFSIGRNKHSNPRPEVVKAVRAKIPNVRIACTQLSKNCSLAIPKTTSSHLLSLFSQGRSSNSCCNGTFIINLLDKISYSPDYSEHINFIKAEVENPMCLN